jgi:hypothetical protein
MYRHSSFFAVLGLEPTDIVREEILKLFGDIENFLFCLEQKRFENEEKPGGIEKVDFLV